MKNVYFAVQPVADPLVIDCMCQIEEQGWEVYAVVFHSMMPVPFKVELVRQQRGPALISAYKIIVRKQYESEKDAVYPTIDFERKKSL
jgi:hypothetical protein